MKDKAIQISDFKDLMVQSVITMGGSNGIIKQLALVVEPVKNKLRYTLTVRNVDTKETTVINKSNLQDALNEYNKY